MPKHVCRDLTTSERHDQTNNEQQKQGECLSVYPDAELQHDRL